MQRPRTAELATRNGNDTHGSRDGPRLPKQSYDCRLFRLQRPQPYRTHASRCSVTAAPQPALFVPHGAPIVLLRPGAAGAALPEAVGRLAMTVGGRRRARTGRPTYRPSVPATRLETIHDFSGFPAELYQMRYPATGCPEAAREVYAGNHRCRPARRFRRTPRAWITARVGAAAVDVPGSRRAGRPAVDPAAPRPRPMHCASARQGAAARDCGIPVTSPGNLTHNLRDYFWWSGRRMATPAYAMRESARRLDVGATRGRIDVAIAARLPA